MTRRLLAGYLTLTLFVLLVLEIPLGLTFARREREELTFRLEHDAVILATFVEDTLQTGDPGPLGSRIETYATDTGARVVVVGTDGIAVLDTDSPDGPRRSFATRPEIDAALGGEVSTGTRRSETLDLDLLYVAVPVASAGVVRGAVRLTYPTSEVDARIRRNWAILAGVAVISLMAAAGVGVAVARSVARPLRRVERSATVLGEGDLSTRAPTGAGPPEVQSLANAFNDMADRIEELVASHSAFAADASHQLRTPLTALRLRLENLEAGGADVDAALTEVQRLSGTVDALLALAQADRAAAHGPSSVVDVERLLEERVTAWAPLADERGVALAVTPAVAAVHARATPERIEQVVDNLLANALEASPSGTTVRLGVAAADGAVEIHVADEGRGMTEEQRRRAFDRFWSGSSGGDLGGSGLGLAIAARLARADGGDVELRTARGGGVDAVIRLAAAVSPADGPR